MTNPYEDALVLVAIAGPNGAGKSTFYRSEVAQYGFRFVNADVIAQRDNIGPYEAARRAASERAALVDERESFVFETVFSDPAGEKVEFLQRAVREGYTVVLCFIGIESAELSADRVAARVTRGGHNVPREKLGPRYARSLENLARAIQALPHVIVYDNSDLADPNRRIAEYRRGRQVFAVKPLPPWFRRGIAG